MIFKYKSIGSKGELGEGTIEAVNVDVAISQLQKRGLSISQIHAEEEGTRLQLQTRILAMFNHVSNKDVVIISRQMATLFSAQIAALRIFTLISSQVENALLKKYFFEIVEDLKGGSSISKALAKHPDAFSDFYVNMVKAGEESGKLDETFNYLADYLERTYEVTSKAKNALIYPAFVITVFVGVMVLMFTTIIPKISVMITESGQEIPFFTKIVLFISTVLVHYGIFVAAGLVVAGFFFWKYIKTPVGALKIDRLRLDIPYIGDLYKKLYLSRIADNLNTMILSGIPILRALEVTSSVVDNLIYKDIIDHTILDVKGGASLSSSIGKYQEIPGMMVQMIKVGEETGELGNILKTVAKFYEREVITAVDTLVSLIEPVMIVSLGLGVGVLLAAVLMPIYNIASTG